jgi:hypothetical protein
MKIALVQQQATHDPDENLRPDRRPGLYKNFKLTDEK